MSPGSLPSPCFASHGVASVMMTTPTTSTSTHFSMRRSLAAFAPALEDDADLSHPGNVPELRHREPHPRRLELAGDDAADVLGERLQQAEAPVGELLRDALDH